MNPIALPIAELKPTLIGLGKVLNKRSTLPVLSHVRVERTNIGHIELGVTDLDTALIARLDTPSQGEPIVFLVPYEDLHNITKGCRSEDTVLISAASDKRISLKFPVAGQIVDHGCVTVPVGEFPVIAEVSGESILLDESLRRSLYEALQCASTDETRRILNGACIDASKPKAHYVVGTDGRHLFSSNSFALPLEESIVVPSHRFLEWKEFQEDGDWTLRVQKVGKADKDQTTRLGIASPHWRFITTSVEGNYPNWHVVVPETAAAQTTVEFAPESLRPVIQLIARLPNHDDVNFTVGLAVKQRCVHLLGKSKGDEGWRQWPVKDVEVTGADVIVRLNRHLLAKALRFGLLKLEIVDAMTPVRFSAGGRQMVIMPVRPDAEPKQAGSARPEPPAASAASKANPPPETDTRKENMSTPKNNDSAIGAAGASEPAPQRPALEVAIGQVDILRGEMRNVLAGLTKVVETLKLAQREQKNNDREIQSVRQTLRSLQTVRI